MGFFDNAVNPQGQSGSSLAGPIMMAAGALILNHMLTGHGASPASPHMPVPAPESHPVPTGAEADGGLLGGLGGLIAKFQKGGAGDAMNSWIGSGPNQPVDPGTLGRVVGQPTLKDIAARAGMSEQDLLNQLAQALPGVVDRLTPQGRLPTADEIANYGRR